MTNYRIHENFNDLNATVNVKSSVIRDMIILC